MSNSELQLKQLIQSQRAERRRDCASYAVRGIGAFGQDMLCTTIQAFTPADALQAVMDANPHNADAARCWVVTKLG